MLSVSRSIPMTICAAAAAIVFAAESKARDAGGNAFHYTQIDNVDLFFFFF